MMDNNRARSDGLRRRAEEQLGCDNGEAFANKNASHEALELIRELRIHQVELEVQNEELVEAQRELSRAKEWFLDLYDFAPVGYLTLSPDGAILDANITAARLLGRPRPAVTGGRLFQFLDDDDRAIYFKHRRQLIEVGESDICELRLIRGDGSRFEAMLQSTPMTDKDGRVVSFRTAVTDISDRKEAERAWQQADTILQASSEGLVVIDTQRRITRINPAFTAMTHFDWPDVDGQDLARVIAGTVDGNTMELFWQTLLREGRWEGELWVERRGEVPFPARLSFVALKDEHGVVTAYAGLIIDVTEQKNAEAELRQRAYYDTLTGVPNRALLIERLKLAAREAQRHGNLMSLMFVDLDRFKETNDRLGHAAGDALLKAVADRLCYCVREHDTVARVGGDEFAVVLSDVDSVESVVTVADKLLNALSPPVWLAGQPIRCHASIGIAVYPTDAQDTDTLTQYADLAMYRSKSSGDMSYCFFQESMTEKAAQHRRTQRELTRALQREEFHLVYQPIVQCASGKVVGAEALLRWQHPKQGLLLPQPFLSVAEDTGQIMALGGWVMETAGRDWQQWSTERMNDEPPYLSINVSPRQLHHPEALHQTMDQIRSGCLPPNLIALEITEGIAMDIHGTAKEYLQKLKQLGVRLSLDDFGTGYSSLGYLRQLPFDSLKIDRSFVNDIETSTEAALLVTAIIQMAHGLNMTVIAEGVETAGQLSYLRQCQCDCMQGNFVSEPVSAGEMRRFLMEGVSFKDTP